MINHITYMNTKKKVRMGKYFYKNHIRTGVGWIGKVVEDITAVPNGDMRAAELGEVLGEDFLDYIACLCYSLFVVWVERDLLVIGYEGDHFVYMNGGC